MKNNSSIKLIINLIISVIIMLVPTIVTGHGYSEERNMGSFLVADYIMRALSFIIGLLVISLSIKDYSSK